MEILLTGAPFVVSALLAAIMGFAIQRGATCMVAAVDEVVSKRRFGRLGAMVAASLWVLSGLLIAQAFELLPRMPAGYAVTGFTILGGALLGLGAFVGRACVFGAIARFGNGEWAYLVVPVGFFVGCATVPPLFMPAMPKRLADGSPVFGANAWGAALCGLLVIGWILRMRRTAQRGDTGAATPVAARFGFAARVWSPGAATTVIGITFFFMLLLVGPWAYTDALADVARKMPHDLAARGALMFALLAGAFVGGLTARRFGSTPVTLPRVARCFASGLLMGWGSLLIPGGNDGLILVGMPLLFPYAWVAMASMALAIGVAMVVTRAAGAPDAHRATPEG
jgi:toxin CptA